MNQTNVHAPEKAHRSCLRSLRGENADEVRTFMFFEDQRRDIRQFTFTIDDGELNVWIVLGDLFHDRSLGKTDADDEVEVALSKRAHRWFDRVRSAWFNVAQNDREIPGRLLHAFPRSSVEGSIVFAADIEDDSDLDLRFIFRR